MTDEERRQHGAAASHMLYAAGRAALAAGLTRSDFDGLAGFWWGQAAADHAHNVAAEAAPGRPRVPDVSELQLGPLPGDDETTVAGCG